MGARKEVKTQLCIRSGKVCTVKFDELTSRIERDWPHTSANVSILSPLSRGHCLFPTRLLDFSFHSAMTPTQRQEQSLGTSRPSNGRQCIDLLKLRYVRFAMQITGQNTHTSNDSKSTPTWQAMALLLHGFHTTHQDSGSHCMSTPKKRTTR